MCLTYLATFIVPSGEYARVVDANGTESIVTGSYRFVEGGLSFTKWILSPFLVLGADGGGAIIAVIIFLLVIGGIFTALDKSGLMEYMLKKLCINSVRTDITFCHLLCFSLCQWVRLSVPLKNVFR